MALEPLNHLNQDSLPSLKIGVLIQDPNWQFDYQGGATTQLMCILQKLQAAHHQVSLVTLRWGGKVWMMSNLTPPTTSKLTFSRSRPFRFVESASRHVQRRFQLPWMQLFDSLRFADACKQSLISFDILHERNFMYGVGGALASRWLNLPYVLFVDAEFLLEHDFLGIKHTRAERIIATLSALYNYRLADAIITVSQATRNHLISKWKVDPDKITVIPNGAEIHAPPDADSVRALRQKLGLDGQLIVMFIGNFWKWHGLSSLVESFHKVTEVEQRAQLLLVGDGETRNSIEKQVHETNLGEKVRFVGRVPHQEVPTYLSLADVTVAPYPIMPMAFWGSPMKVLEYMAAGKAIVATRTGDIPTLLGQGATGLLTDPDDVDEMARCILTLLRDASLRAHFGTKARRRVEKEYSWAVYVRKLEEIYYEVIERSKSKVKR